MGKFKIKISPTWYSDEFIVLKYTTNNIFWKTIYGYEYGYQYNRAHMVKKTWHYSNAKYLMQKFKTLEDVKKYEAEELKKVKQKNEEIVKQNKKKKEDKKRIYKKFG